MSGIPGGFKVGETVFYASGGQTFSNGASVVYGGKGTVVGAGTGEGTGRVAVQFPGNKGNVNCFVEQLSRTPPGPLPGGFKVNDTVYFVGANCMWPSGDTVVYGGSGIVVGAGTGAAAGQVAVKFPQNNRHVPLAVERLSKTPPGPLPGGFEAGGSSPSKGPAAGYTAAAAPPAGASSLPVAPATATAAAAPSPASTEAAQATRFKEAPNVEVVFLPIEGVMDAKYNKPLAEVMSWTGFPRHQYLARDGLAVGEEKGPDLGLTPEQAGVFHIYSRDGSNPLYKLLNELLRNRNRRDLLPFFGFLHHAFAGYQNMRKFEGTTWRGVPSDLSHAYKPGARKYWCGFTSTTTDPAIVHNFTGGQACTIFELEVKGGVNIKDLSAYEDEAEILLMPGTCFEVTKVQPADVTQKLFKLPSGTNIVMVYLKELPREADDPAWM